MPIIPRYQPRGGPRTEDLNYARAYSPADGSDWRMLAQAAQAAGSIVQLAQTVFKPQEDAQQEGPKDPRRTPSRRPTSLGQGAARGVDPLAAVAATEREVAWREAQLASDDANEEIGAEAVAQSRQAMAQDLPEGARRLFDMVTLPREAGFAVQAAARKQRGAATRWESLALRREQLGVEEYVRQSEIDEGLGRMALASAVAQRGERLAVMGLDPGAIQAGKAELMAAAETARIHRALVDSPQRARTLLAVRGQVLSDQQRAMLARDIDAEQARVEAGQVVAGLEREIGDAADNLEGLAARANAAAGADPARQAAYHGAALSAWRAARTRRDAAEGNGWRALEPLLSQAGGDLSWTDVPAPIWATLSQRQREAFRTYSEAPPRTSDRAVLGRVMTTAAQAPEAFADFDLTPIQPSLTYGDFSALQNLRQAAREDTAAWREDQGRLAQADGMLDAVAAEQGVSLTDAARGDFFADLGRQAEKGAWPEPDAVLTLCQQTVSKAGKPKPATLRWMGNPNNPPFDVRKGVAADGLPDFGGLARAYETPGADPYKISTGKGDPGGISYGEWQMATTPGTPTAFLKSLEGRKWAPRFTDPKTKKLYAPGTPEFGKAWTATTSADEAGFRRDQAAFMRKNYYEPQLKFIQQQTGIDLSDRSYAVQAAIFSTAVREGPSSRIISDVLRELSTKDGRELSDYNDGRNDGGIGDYDLIGAIYARREAKAREAGVKSRMRRERVSALTLFDTDPKKNQSHVFRVPSRRGPPIP